MRTRRVTRKPANGQTGSPEDGWMGSAYLGVIVVELLVLVALWAVGTYFSSL